jgi:hypothetical protein
VLGGAAPAVHVRADPLFDGQQGGCPIYGLALLVRCRHAVTCHDKPSCCTCWWLASWLMVQRCRRGGSWLPHQAWSGAQLWVCWGLVGAPSLPVQCSAAVTVPSCWSAQEYMPRCQQRVANGWHHWPGLASTQRPCGAQHERPCPRVSVSRSAPPLLPLVKVPARMLHECWVVRALWPSLELLPSIFCLSLAVCQVGELRAMGAYRNQQTGRTARRGNCPRFQADTPAAASEGGLQCRFPAVFGGGIRSEVASRALRSMLPVAHGRSLGNGPQITTSNRWECTPACVVLCVCMAVSGEEDCVLQLGRRLCRVLAPWGIFATSGLM